ncbi:hypothetical protein MGYG_05277 [Nannizzia gypsea CBS 118893]|uniref:Uncharacterized protein n=1 Tax=Arthroderma gypseum (strain ATCC MYA-4604 / CBS 118893) TaxID=535722 RepID=E4UVF0_ARTGP|nr:hypothetical protein MGYG_05277 [Nannizzia gypsea CBS 118893]EFR02277.1 hypothetical protein MGYG_05277 [Nannizzia gypsea CBS 118893]
MILDTDLEKQALLSCDASDLQRRHSTSFLEKFKIPRAREWLSQHCVRKKCDSCQQEKEHHKETQEITQLECEKLKQYLCQRESQLRKGYELQIENLQYKWHQQQAEFERLREYVNHECQQQKECPLQNYNSLYNRVADLKNQINEHSEATEGLVAFALSRASLGPSDTQEFAVKNVAAKRFEQMCYFEEHDNEQKKGYCCRGCLDRHPSSASFSQQEFTKAPSKRYCLETQPAIQLGTLPGMSFRDVKNLVLAAGNGEDMTTFPEIVLEHRLRIFPTSEHKNITVYGFAHILFNIDYPMCPHTQIFGVLTNTLFKNSSELADGWADESYQCRVCKTHVSFEILPADTRRNNNREWCALKVRRTIGRLYSPLEEDWLAQAYAYEHPHVDDHNKLSDDWFREYWRTLSKGSPSSGRPGFDLKKCRDISYSSLHRYQSDSIFPLITDAASHEEYRVHSWVRSQSTNPKARVIKIRTCDEIVAVEEEK